MTGYNTTLGVPCTTSADESEKAGSTTNPDGFFKDFKVEDFEDFVRRRNPSADGQRPQTINDFVSEVEHATIWDRIEEAEATYQRAEEFAGKQPDQNTADILLKMKSGILDTYSGNNYDSTLFDRIEDM